MNPVGVVVHEIQRELDVDGVLIGLLEHLESLPHILDELGPGEQVVERRHPDLVGAAGVVESDSSAEANISTGTSGLSLITSRKWPDMTRLAWRSM